jgi:hypothetical protein
MEVQTYCLYRQVANWPYSVLDKTTAKVGKLLLHKILPMRIYCTFFKNDSGNGAYCLHNTNPQNYVTSLLQC